jgi:hypothetical protein
MRKYDVSLEQRVSRLIVGTVAEDTEGGKKYHY